MRLSSRILATVLGAIILTTTVAAQTPSPTAPNSGTKTTVPPAPSSRVESQQAGKPVCGWQLMTEQERVEYRAKMLSFKTPEERAKFRAAHHELMTTRAKERGLTLPNGPGTGCGKGAAGMRGPGPKASGPGGRE